MKDIFQLKINGKQVKLEKQIPSEQTVYYVFVQKYGIFYILI